MKVHLVPAFPTANVKYMKVNTLSDSFPFLCFHSSRSTPSDLAAAQMGTSGREGKAMRRTAALAADKPGA